MDAAALWSRSLRRSEQVNSHHIPGGMSDGRLQDALRTGQTSCVLEEEGRATALLSCPRAGAAPVFPSSPDKSRVFQCGLGQA